MARWKYIPHDEVREQEREDDKAARKAAFNDPIDDTPEDPKFGRLNPEDDEFESVTALAEYLYDDDRETYTRFELQCVWFRTGLRIQQIRAELAEYGLTLERRPMERVVRGFSDSPYTLYAGNPMCGGGGGGSIIGVVD